MKRSRALLWVALCAWLGINYLQVTLFKSAVGDVAAAELSLNQLLVESSNITNADLPKQMDEETRVDTTFVQGNTFHYKYTLVRYNYEQLDRDILATELTKPITERTCQNKLLEHFLGRGATIVHSYLSRDAKPVLIVSVAASQCRH